MTSQQCSLSSYNFNSLYKVPSLYKLSYFQLISLNCHLGSNVQKWQANTRMYIMGERNKYYIIDVNWIYIF
jgi:ribosomal protein S2